MEKYTMRLKIIFFSFSLVLFSLSAHAQDYPPLPKEENFKQIVNRTLERIRATAGAPVSIFKKPREANEKIIKGMELIQIDRNYEAGRDYLKQAIATNKDNFFAYLLTAITLELDNKTEESTPFYLGFLKHSLETSFYEHNVPIEPKEIQFLRAHVRELLLSRNVDIPAGIKNLDLGIGGFSLFALFEDKELYEVIYDTLFYFFILLGLMYYFFRKYEGPSYHLEWENILFKLVWSACAVGAVEVAQMIFDLPYWYSPLTQRTILLALFAGAYVTLSLYKEKRDIRELLKNRQYRQCPQCKKVIPKINVECPNCKTRVT